METKTYWLVDEQEHSLDRYGAADLYGDGLLVRDGRVDTDSAHLFPFSIIESEKAATVKDVEKHDIDFDFCRISEEDAHILSEALGKDFKDDDHWLTLEDMTYEQRREDEEYEC